MWRFHPDGSLYELGQFVDGVPRGAHRRYASGGPAGEPLQSCCVPRGAWQLRQDYGPEGVVFRGWFNHDGARLLETGELYPQRPPSVPPDAEVDEGSRMWEAGGAWTPGGRTGTRRRWSLDGVLRLVEELRNGERDGMVRSFSETGDLAWEARYARNHLSGPFQARDLRPGHFVDPDVTRQEGWFTDDQACGTWRFLDDAGVVRAARDLGVAIDPDALAASSVLDRGQRSADAWRALEAELAASGRIGEALLAAARAAAASGDPDRLRQTFATRTMPLGADIARVEANAVIDRATGKLVTLTDGLKRGGDAASLLGALAKALPGAPRVAHELATAALLLAPDATEPLATRALLRAQLGAVEAARADIARLASGSPEQVRLLELVLRGYFPRFDFWPARVALENDAADEAGPRPERSLEEVRDAVARYATRLMRLRAVLRARVAGEAPFMIPDLSALLPAGPSPLRAWTFTMSAEEYQGAADDGGGDTDDGDTDDGDTGEPHANEAALSPDAAPDSDEQPVAPRFIEISVDEAAGLGDDGEDLLPVMRQARADWSGLTWLCWAVGLASPGLPDAIVPPLAFGRAAVMTLERAWRCRDKLRTSGLFALSKGIPGFDWEDTPIDLIPSTLADVALAEYVEARAVFSWLCDPANRSPWQDDLRAAD
jgi:hypothetical protein